MQYTSRFDLRLSEGELDQEYRESYESALKALVELPEVEGGERFWRLAYGVGYRSHAVDFVGGVNAEGDEAHVVVVGAAQEVEWDIFRACIAWLWNVREVNVDVRIDVGSGVGRVADLLVPHL